MTKISHSIDLGYGWHQSLYLGYYKTLYHENMDTDKSLWGCMHPTRIRSLWHIFHAPLTLFKAYIIVGKFDTLELEDLVSCNLAYRQTLVQSLQFQTFKQKLCGFPVINHHWKNGTAHVTDNLLNYCTQCQAFLECNF